MKLDFDATVVADSVAPNGVRLTTMLLTYPRFIHAELMTHRVFSRNAASSRAIPVRKKVARIRERMVEPVEWGKNQKGMSAAEVLGPEEEKEAKFLWRDAGLYVLNIAEELDGLKVHKQIANRILEPWDWMVTLVSSTKWNNWDALRDHHAADPNIRKLARLCKEARAASVPRPKAVGEWHLPFIEDRELVEIGTQQAKMVSAGRCARLSYLTFEGVRDYEEDVALYHRLIQTDSPGEPKHMTPLEHQATPIDGIMFTTFNSEYVCASAVRATCVWCGKDYPLDDPAVELSPGYGSQGYFASHPGIMEQPDVVCMKCAMGHVTSGNFHGWRQHRHEIPGESIDG